MLRKRKKKKKGKREREGRKKLVLAVLAGINSAEGLISALSMGDRRPRGSPQSGIIASDLASSAPREGHSFSSRGGRGEDAHDRDQTWKRISPARHDGISGNLEVRRG